MYIIRSTGFLTPTRNLIQKYQRLHIDIAYLPVKISRLEEGYVRGLMQKEG